MHGSSNMFWKEWIMIKKYLCACDCVYSLLGVPRSYSRVSTRSPYHPYDQNDHYANTHLANTHYNKMHTYQNNSSQNHLSCVYKQPEVIHHTREYCLSGEADPSFASHLQNTNTKRNTTNSIFSTSSTNTTVTQDFTPDDLHIPMDNTLPVFSAYQNDLYTSSSNVNDTQTSTNSDTSDDVVFREDYDETQSKYTTNERDLWHVL